MSPPAARVPFQKPWLSFRDQVRLLQQRGLIVSDVAAAEAFVSHLNYYRFSGYCLPYQTQNHHFIAGTTFEQIVSTYQFDLTLRDLFTEALEVVEVDLRTAVAYHFGERYQAFGHTRPTSFHPTFNHAAWLDLIRDETRRSSELFVTHFRNNYLEYPDLPIWIVTEVMSFGCLSRMLGKMHKRDQKPIAQRYGLQPIDLCKAVHHLTYVRNVCAHHARLWDRVWSIKPQLPAGHHWRPPLLPGNDRLFVTLLLLRKLLDGVPALQSFVTTWHARMSLHLHHPPGAHGAYARMGLTANWHEHPLWA